MATRTAEEPDVAALFARVRAADFVATPPVAEVAARARRRRRLRRAGAVAAVAAATAAVRLLG